MGSLFQPIFTKETEPGHDPKDALNLDQFLKLLREEEDYYPGEQHNTKLMFTRLRKIFYDQWGWNSELIRGATNIETRYIVSVIDVPSENTRPLGTMSRDPEVPGKHRTVMYSDHDKIYGNTRVGQTPEIYKNDHQEVLLPEGYYCDVAHILAGVDATNYPQVVSPLPNWLTFLEKWFPHVNSNIDVVTWVGDIASTAGDFLYAYLRNNNQPISSDTEQKYINIDVPGSDMLGDIDALVIASNYDISALNGMRVTEIYEDYYIGKNHKTPLKDRRLELFCKHVGLSWDGKQFTNEADWMKYQYRELRGQTEFQVFSLTDEKLDGIWLPLKIYFGFYAEVIKIKLLLNLLLEGLKTELRKT
jgi:hypothetical protein